MTTSTLVEALVGDAARAGRRPWPATRRPRSRGRRGARSARANTPVPAPRSTTSEPGPRPRASSTCDVGGRVVPGLGLVPGDVVGVEVLGPGVGQSRRGRQSSRAIRALAAAHSTAGSGRPSAALRGRGARRAGRRRRTSCGRSTTIASVTALVCAFVASRASFGIRTSVADELVDGGVELVVVDDAVEEAGRLGLVGAELAARHHELLRQRRADLAHEPRDAAPRQRDAELDLGDREAAPIGRRRAGRTRRPARGRRRRTSPAPWRRDGAQLVHRPGHPPPAVGVVARRPRRRRSPAPNDDTSAPAENARPRPDTTTTFRSSWRVEPAGRGLDLAQRVRRQRVELVGAVEHERPAAPSTVDLDGVEPRGLTSWA